VATYTQSPLISGYISKQNLQKVGQSAAIIAKSEGAGRVILFADNPNFRGTWYGTNRLFLNAIFLGQIMDSPTIGENLNFDEE
jgi:hypothetical protein